MVQIEKTIFNGEYFVFKNPNKIVNNCGIISKDGDVAISERFENVMYSVADWAIVTTRYRVYQQPENIYYGIIDKDINMIIDPDKNEYRGYDGYLQIENILKSFYEEKYGIDNDKKNFLVKSLIYKKWNYMNKYLILLNIKF